MKKFIQQKLKNQKGMTLIELLAVIVIIAIIAAIAIPAIGNIIQNARVGAVKSDAINIISAAKIYKSENAAGSVTNVTLGDLETAGLIGDAGTFEGAIKTGVGAVTVNLTSDAITGKNAVVNNIELEFIGATVSNINALPNGSPASSTAVNNIKVISR